MATEGVEIVAGQKAVENNKDKENGGASNVMDPIQKELNFTTLAMGPENAYLHGVLTYDIGCREWSWKLLRCIRRSDRSGQYDTPFVVEGLVLMSHVYAYTRRVFDVHANLWHEIPAEPEYGEATRVLGVTVDASAKPCTFKLIVGSQDTGTQIYDSRTGKWVKKASRLIGCLHPGPTYVENSCLHANGCVYIRAENDVTGVYSLETDSWSKLPLPQRHRDDRVLRSLGVWQGRIFTVMETCFTSVSVWELIHETKQEWREHDQVSTDIYEWLMEGDHSTWAPSLINCFCDEYLLIYCWRTECGEVNRFLLFNLATKLWEKMDLPPGSAGVGYGYDIPLLQWGWGNDG